MSKRAQFFIGCNTVSAIQSAEVLLAVYLGNYISSTKNSCLVAYKFVIYLAIKIIRFRPVGRAVTRSSLEREV